MSAVFYNLIDRIRLLATILLVDNLLANRIIVDDLDRIVVDPVNLYNIFIL